MIKIKRPIRFSFVIVISFSVMTGILLMIAMALFFGQYRSTLLKSAATNSAQAVEQVENTLSNYTEDMITTLNLLQERFEDPETDRDDFLDSFLEIRPDVCDVTSYDRAGNLTGCWVKGHELKDDIFRNLSFDPEFAQSEQTTTAPHVVSIFEGYYPWVVTMSIPLSSGEWLSVDFSFARISSYINSVGIGQHGYCFLIDGNNEIIYHPQQQLIYAGLKAEKTQELSLYDRGVFTSDNVIYAVNTIHDSNWKVVGVSYIDELITAETRKVYASVFLIAAGMAVVALIASMLTATTLVSPLHSLRDAMKRFEKDAEGFVYQPIRGPEEIRELSSSFGHMVGKIKELMDRIREEEQALQKSELKALQAQINPHFLYNTLDSIAVMCERGKNKEAAEMVTALASLFRISISKGRELIPISKELEHATSYLQIQSIRYRNQFTYSIDADPSCLNYLCNKITLQPIIENAILHGINYLVDEGEILISVHPEGDDILMIVEDNGVGMEPETVAKLMSDEITEKHGVGVRNVNERLKIYFGEKYGITIESEPDLGTRVMIRMPKLSEDEYEARG